MIDVEEIEAGRDTIPMEVILVKTQEIQESHTRVSLCNHSKSKRTKARRS